MRSNRVPERAPRPGNGVPDPATRPHRRITLRPPAPRPPSSIVHRARLRESRCTGPPAPSCGSPKGGKVRTSTGRCTGKVCQNRPPPDRWTDPAPSDVEENGMPRRPRRLPGHGARARRRRGGRRAAARRRRGEPAPRVSGGGSRLVRGRRRSPRGELRLVRQPLSADRTGRTVRPLPLRRRGAGAQARSSGKDRGRRRGLRRRAAGPAGAPAFRARPRCVARGSWTRDRRRAPAPALDREPCPRTVRPRRARRARAHRALAAAGGSAAAGGERGAGGAVRPRPRRRGRARALRPRALRARLGRGPVTCFSTPPCTARSRSGWCCFRVPGPTPGRCSGSSPGRPRGASSSGSDSRLRGHAHSERRDGPPDRSGARRGGHVSRECARSGCRHGPALPRLLPFHTGIRGERAAPAGAARSPCPRVLRAPRTGVA